MDRFAELSSELSSVLEQLRREAVRRDLRELSAPLAWLDEANGWFKYELARARAVDVRDPVPFTYIPVDVQGSASARSSSL
jgi:hypothetical protein